MKLKTVLLTILISALLLTACTASRTPKIDSAAKAGSLPMATQLILGTLKLEGTEQDVTAQEAAELLPMWQVYSELLSSDTAAQQEIDGLIAQIQETMTDEQMKAITDMNLSQEDVMAVMQEKGLGMAGGQNLSADQIATAQALRDAAGGGGFAGGPPDGGGMGMPAGGPPDAGGMPGGGMSVGGGSSSRTNDSTSTGSAQGPMGGENGVPTVLIQALIEMLQAKAGS